MRPHIQEVVRNGLGGSVDNALRVPYAPALAIVLIPKHPTVHADPVDTRSTYRC